MRDTVAALALFLSASVFPVFCQEFRPIPAEPLTTSFAAGGSAIADIDGNGLADVVYADNGDIIYLPDFGISGPLSMPQQIMGPGNLTPGGFFVPVLRVVEDFDGDGDIDVLGVREEGLFAGSNFYLARNQGAGTFGSLQIPLTSLAKVGNIQTMDLNGDSLRDIVVINDAFGGMGTLQIWRQTAMGTFVMVYSDPNESPRRFAIGDFNGDGFDDLSFVGSARIEILLGAANGTVSVGGSLSIPGGILDAVTAGDLNEDGRDDVLLTNLFDSGNPFRLSFVAGSTTSILATPVALSPNGPTGQSAREVFVEDIDGDGRADITGRFAPVGLRESLTWRGDGNGGISPTPYTYLSAVTGSSNWVLGTGDLDGDGDLDSYYVNRNTSEMFREENRAIYGGACAGAGGEPTLSFGVASPGNPAYTITLDNAAPSATAAIFIATADQSASGCGVLVDLAALLQPTSLGYLPLSTDGNGSATATLAIPNGVALLPSVPLYVQAGIVDPAGSLSQGGSMFAATQGRTVRVY